MGFAKVGPSCLSCFGVRVVFAHLAATVLCVFYLLNSIRTPATVPRSAQNPAFLFFFTSRYFEVREAWHITFHGYCSNLVHQQ